MYDPNLWQSRIYGTLHRSLVVFSVWSASVARMLYPFQHGVYVSTTSDFYLTVYCCEFGCSRAALHCIVDDITLNYVTLNGRRFVNDGEREWGSSQAPKQKIWA